MLFRHQKKRPAIREIDEGTERVLSFDNEYLKKLLCHNQGQFWQRKRIKSLHFGVL